MARNALERLTDTTTLMRLCLVVTLAFSQGCLIGQNAPPPAAAPVPAGALPAGPITTPTSTIPAAGTATTPGALAVAITSATPTKVDGSVTNVTLPAALNVAPTGMKVDLIAQDGVTVIGTVNPDGAAGNGNAGGTQPFSITPTAALTVGQAVSAKATQSYPTAQTRVATSSPVQVTAAATTTATPAGGTTTTGGTTTGTTTAVPRLSIQLASSGASTTYSFTGFPPSSAVQTAMTVNGAAVASQPLTADASGNGSGTLAISPAVAVGQTFQLKLTGSNGATVTGTQVSDGR